MRTEYELGELLEYEQPTKYAVESTKYDDKYSTPVLTAGKSFILGYTNETDGIYDNLPVIIFDDFTTATQYVNFKFKVKSSAMKILKANEELALTKYLYYLMQTIHCDHDTHKRYWIQTYSKIKVSIPSLTEQQRIVEKIEELFSKLDKGVEELNKIKEQLKIYRQAVLKEAFDGIESYKKISDLFDVTGGLTKNSKRNELPLRWKYLRVANVFYNYIDTTEIKSIGVKPEEIEKTLLKRNDLLFVEGNGSKDQIGRVAIWNNEIENCLHQNHIIKARPTKQVLSKFALYYLMSTYGRKQITQIASSTSGLYTLSTNKVKNLYVPTCDIKQQEKIICEIESRLSVCDKIEQTVNESLQKAESLRQSILKQAFEGR